MSAAQALSLIRLAFTDDPRSGLYAVTDPQHPQVAAAASAALRDRHVTCPDCTGAGETGTGQDYYGNWETETCRTCRGAGDLTPEDAVHLLRARCAHGVPHDAECDSCRRERHTNQPAPNPSDDPWSFL